MEKQSFDSAFFDENRLCLDRLRGGETGGMITGTEDEKGIDFIIKLAFFYL